MRRLFAAQRANAQTKMYELADNRDDRVLIRESDASGVDCAFYNLTKNVGLKVYYNEYSARHTRWMQQILSYYDICPQVDSTIIKVRTNNSIPFYYGYLTETIGKFSRESNEHARMKYTLNRLLDELGVELIDAHDGNYGVKDGKAYIIDVGHLDFTPNPHEQSLLQFAAREFSPFILCQPDKSR